MPSQYDVCSTQVSVTIAEGSIIWTNSRNNECTVSEPTGQPWPFAQSSYVVAANGSTQASLKSGVQAGSYPFVCTCCPSAGPMSGRVIIIT